MKHSKILIFLLFIASSASFAQQTTETLKLKNQLKVNLEAGQVFKYLIALKKAQFASIKVHQNSVGVGYAVYDTKDSLIANGDMNAMYQTEVINIEAKQTGNYRIEIFWDYGYPQKGSFTITWDTLEPIAHTAQLRAEQYLNSWYNADMAGVSIAVLKKGKVIYKSSKGVANMEYKIPISSTSAFELASCSKQFTGFAMALLIEQGKLALDDDIRKYLPELPDYGTKITIEHLIYHTSGIRNWDALSNGMGFKSDDIITTDMVYRMICNTKELNFKPNETFSYTNTGYNLLALIVEKVTNQTFDKWSRENIFEPLGMKNTTVKDNTKKVIYNKANSYKRVADGFEVNLENTSLIGSTSVYSTIDDLIMWVNNFETKKLGNKKVFELLDRKITLNNGQILDFYSFGNGFGNHKGIKNIEHLGSVSGFRTVISRYPEQELAVIFLSNDNNDASFMRSWSIADLFLENIKENALEPIVFPNLKEALAHVAEPSKCPVDTKQYEGIYYAEETNSHYKIINKNGVLIAISYQFDYMGLTWEKEDNFLNKFGSFERKLQFERTNNIVSAFKLIGLEREILFKKISY